MVTVRRRRKTASERGHVVVATIESRVLRANPLGDPHVRHVPVYLPPGYDASAERYPVLVGLSGFTGSGRMMLNVSAWSETLNERLDRLQAEGTMGPTIVVMPDCFTRFGGSQYLNSSAIGRYEDHLIHEVIPHVDAQFRTAAAAEHRGVFGKSSGGYAALVQAMKHPEIFGAVACHSGDMAFEYCYMPDFPKLIRQVERHRGVEAFVRAFEAAPRKTGAHIEAMNIVAMAAAYSPDPKRRPLGIAFPMDLHTGALDPQVWNRWLRHDPLRMLRRYADRLRRLKALFLDCGTRDEFNLHLGARQFAARLRALGIRHTYEEFDDGHMGLTYRFDRSLPLLWKALQPRPGRRSRADARGNVPGRRP
jgi:enterochelin esterase family protein